MRAFRLVISRWMVPSAKAERLATRSPFEALAASFARSVALHLALPCRDQPGAQVPAQRHLPFLGPLADLDRHLLTRGIHLLHQRSVKSVHCAIGVLAFVG